MARFADALESHPAPARLGDVALRYEPSVLIGETPKGRRTVTPTAVWVVGLSLLLFSAAAVVTLPQVVPAVALAVGGAVFVAFAVLLERLEKRQRRFVLNFETHRLRLDFSSPIAGYPRTLLVPFDDVQALQLLEQADGALCLVADFALHGRTLREVLVAFVPAAQRAELERLQRVLEGAFGPGVAPPDDEAPSGGVATMNEESTFE
jgi:hypothetical protein